MVVEKKDNSYDFQNHRRKAPNATLSDEITHCPSVMEKIAYELEYIRRILDSRLK
jgi:hypothetical protein